MSKAFTQLFLRSLISFLYLFMTFTPAFAEVFPQTYDIDTGFRPDQNGFRFENYGNELCGDIFCFNRVPVQNLTAAEMHRLFGDRVCKEIHADGRCELLRVAESWMKDVNREMDDGHCEGMAVLSALFFAGLKDPATYGSQSVNQLKLKGNPELQKEIAYWYATQWYMDDYLIEKDPTTQLRTLIDEFSNNPDILIPIGIYKRDFSDGHSLLAYAVQQQEEHLYRVMIYDNNYPREERYIEIDTHANSWMYSGKAMIDEEEDLYDGEDDTNPFQLAPILSRLDQFECDFCPSGTSPWATETQISDSPWDAPDALPELESSPWTEPTPQPQAPVSPWGPPPIEYNKISVNSAINIYIESEDGAKAGYDWNDEITYKEIPNVEILRAMQRTTAKLPTDLVYYLWMNSPDKSEWLTFDVDITSPGTILYLSGVLESYEYPNLIYTPRAYDSGNDVNYETFEVVTATDYLPGVEFVISENEGEYGFSFITEYTGEIDPDINVDFLIYHDYDSGQLGIEIYAANDEEEAHFEGGTFRIHGEFSITNGNGEHTILLSEEEALELAINGAFYINYLNWGDDFGYFIDADLDGDYELETTIELSSLN